MKSQLSSFELSYLLSEMQFLVGAKVEKIFQQAKPKDDLLFVLHVPGKGKQYLYLSLPGVFSLSNFKPSFPDNPPFFASSLRRKLSNARIQSIVQKDFERIVIFEFSTKHGKSFLIIELFSPGNVILCDENMKILSVLHPKKWSDRSVLPNKPYEFPPSQLNPHSLSFDDFKSLLLKSDKDSLVKSLAIDFSLGGVYSEEVIFNSGLDKNISPSSLSEDDFVSLFGSLTSFLSSPLNPHKSSSEVFPIGLVSIPDLIPINSFNEGIQDLILSKLEREEAKEFSVVSSKAKSKFEKIISSQEAQLKGLAKEEFDNQLKGELIYTHYQSLKILVDKINELLDEDKSWDEIYSLIKEVPQVKKLDGSTATLELDLEVK